MAKLAPVRAPFLKVLFLCRRLFAGLVEPREVLNLDQLTSGQPTHRERVSREFAALASAQEASISITLYFTKDDLAKIGSTAIRENNNVILTLVESNVTGSSCAWSINTGSEDETTILCISGTCTIPQISLYKGQWLK